MRSSKSRSRNKSGRNNRSVGNIINRVFDSSGPEGKVRGTPQQIVDKYNQLARDAQLAGDRVLAENFQQHAEHYLRLLSSAQKEQEQRREEQERQNRERQAERDRERTKRQERESNNGGDPSDTPQPDLVEEASEDSGLVETPETKKSDKPKRTRKPKPKQANDGTQGEAGQEAAKDDGNNGAHEAAE